MLNNLKDWAAEKGDQATQVAHGVANEVHTKNVMDWSGTVWLVIAGAVVLMVIVALGNRS